MRTSPLRLGAATFQVCAGPIAVLLTSATLTWLVDPRTTDGGRGLLFGSAFVLGLGLFLIWVAARRRRPWLIVLTALSGALTVTMIIFATIAYRPTRFEAGAGLWESFWTPVLGLVLWLLITVAGLVELRQLGKPEAEHEPAGWAKAIGVVAPIVLLIAVAIVLWQVMPGVVLRLNSDTPEPAQVETAGASQLTGGQRWQRDLGSYPSANGEVNEVVTDSGLAVGVPSDGEHNAGVLMLDPTTGAIRWRYQLRGLDDPPTLDLTGGGSAIVVTAGGGRNDAGQEIPQNTFTLDPGTGQVLDRWPDSMAETDPPVDFRHVAQGANSVIAYSQTGKKLWTYHPESCADPRGVTSTPAVILVPARYCGGKYNDLRLLGLDAGTGKQRWVQPYDGGESGPDQLLVRSDLELESTGKELQRRDLNTGKVDWSTKMLSTCALDDPDSTASSRTVYLDRCDGADLEPRTMVAYGIETGTRQWQRRLDRPIQSIAAVDDRQVLAVVSDDKTCSVELVAKSKTTTLLSLPSADDGSHPFAAQCQTAAVLRVDGSYVLRVGFRPSNDSLTLGTRYIGLS